MAFGATALLACTAFLLVHQPVLAAVFTHDWFVESLEFTGSARTFVGEATTILEIDDDPSKIGELPTAKSFRWDILRYEFSATTDAGSLAFELLPGSSAFANTSTNTEFDVADVFRYLQVQSQNFVVTNATELFAGATDESATLEIAFSAPAGTWFDTGLPSQGELTTPRPPTRFSVAPGGTGILTLIPPEDPEEDDEEPAEGGTKFRWIEPSNGSFGSNSNWEPTGVPGFGEDSKDVMIVDVSGDFTISDSPDKILFKAFTKQTSGTVTLDPNGDFFRTDKMFVKGDTRLIDGEFSFGFESLGSGAEKTALTVKNGAVLTVGQNATVLAGYDIVDLTRTSEDLPFESVLVGLTSEGEQLVIRDGARFTADGIDLRAGNLTFTGAGTEVKLMNLSADGSAVDLASLSLSSAASLRVGRLAEFALGSASVFDGNVEGAGTAFTGLDGIVGPREMVVGVAGDAKLDFSLGALLQAGPELIIGKFDNASGRLIFNSTSTLMLPQDGSAVDILVGDRGHGLLEFRGFSELQSLNGLAAESSIVVGKEATATGTVLFDGLAVSGEAAKIKDTTIGEAGDGKFSVRDGALYETESLLISNQAGSRGELIIEGTDTDFSVKGGNSSIVFGIAGEAIVTVADGASLQDLGTSGQAMSIGSNAQNANAEVTFRDGATGLLSEVSIGENSTAARDSARTGALVINGASVLTTDNFRIGNRGELAVVGDSGGLDVVGDLMLSNPGDEGPGGLVSVVGGRLKVFDAINGSSSEFQLNDGAVLEASSLTLGDSQLKVEAGAGEGSSLTLSANAILTDVQALVSGKSTVLDAGPQLTTLDSKLDVLDSATVRANDIDLLDRSTISVKSDGVISAQGQIVLADSSEMTLNSGGKISTNNLRVESQATLNAFNQASLNLTGAMTITDSSFVDLFGDTNASVAGDLAVNNLGILAMRNGATMTVSGNAFFGDGIPAVSLTGSGTTLDITNNLTTANAILSVDDSARVRTFVLRAESGSVVTGTNGGRIEFGTAIIAPGATVSPGKSPGILTLAGDATFEPDSTLLLEVGGLQPGLEYDVLVVEGDLTINGLVQFSFIDGFAPKQNDQFEFLMTSEAADITGAQFEVANLDPSFLFEIAPSTNGILMTALNDGVFVPEPSSTVLLLAGVATFLLWRRHRGPRRAWSNQS